MYSEKSSILFCLVQGVAGTEILPIFVQINKGKQLFIPLANLGNLTRRLFEPGMIVVSPVLCLDLRVGAGTGAGRLSGSWLPKASIERVRLALFCWEQSRAVIIPGRRPAVALRSGFQKKSPCRRPRWIFGAVAVI